jgi:lipopolysaccharide exporter
VSVAIVARAAAFLKRKDGGVWSKVIRSGFWVSISILVVNSLQVLRSIVLARLLTPEIFGLMALCLIVTRGIEVFSETGVRPALIHRRERFEEALDTGFCVMAVRGFVLAAVATLIAPLAAWYYGQPQLTAIVAVMSLTFVVVGFTNINTINLEKQLEFKRLTHVEQVSAIVSFTIVVALAVWLRSIWALAIGQVLGAAVGVAASYLMIPGRPKLRFDRQLARELMRYGRFVTGLTIVLFFTTELDNMVVGKVLGLESLGYYLIAYTLANLPATHLSKVLSRIMFPAYALMRDTPGRLASAYLGVVEVVSVVSLGAAAGLFVLADDIVRIGYGPKWLPAVPSLKVLALFGALRAITSINGYLFNAIGRPNLPFYLNTAKLALIVAVIVPVTRRYGIVGASIAVTAPSVLFAFISMAQLDRFAGVPWRKNLRALLRPVASSVAMAAVVSGLRSLAGPIGLAGLAGLILSGATLVLLLNIDVVSRVYREQRRQEPTAVPA